MVATPDMGGPDLPLTPVQGPDYFKTIDQASFRPYGAYPTPSPSIKRSQPTLTLTPATP